MVPIARVASPGPDAPRGRNAMAVAGRRTGLPRPTFPAGGRGRL